MDSIEKVSRRYRNFTRVSAALLYAVAVSMALNFFWEPGGIYASGVTGFAQLMSTVLARMGITFLGTPFWLVALNLPLFILAWRKIGHHFTWFTILAVVLSSLLLHFSPIRKLTVDPILCAIFGALFNGAGTGFALRSGISTGGLDILGIVLRKKTGKSVGSINIAFNALIVLLSGFIYSWPHALYSALGIFINGRVIDMIYTQDQRLQVIIVTNHPRTVIAGIQEQMRRGITIMHDAEGAYRHEEKTVLLTVISQYELRDLTDVMHESDAHAFVSVTPTVRILGHYYEPKRE
ncbi:DUF2179 domain-containing protein [Schleiferilactobacillus harbinensis]|jgi:uncharacterized membrane-anchored protein YitT (DUF2179 family)|uniref:DUF2179 domain-containing protein n=2 Tax=Schleiferilactobacillus harbinensis TaxID=304207 RepID=A0A510TU49_9LACO|nr:YitT family protein [Schleiferilactobacillus harbinensis]HAY53539.1 YitT family protein [Lactobacillus sp.]KRM26488.1 hypothetical protein FC91_GL003025 [Schleiferilactobacillus harbinensis DSM 16991]MBO3091650.1 YitT family protein [Schleiferilactobacillus harbinensis]MCI1688504.1 YitT family protein [Schleiferilactobacillus harbinensis]MCI1782211.1 YitT family protein [Schleiferilactobacillus harbinensis]